MLRIYKQMKDGRRKIEGLMLKGDFMGMEDDEVYQKQEEEVVKLEMCEFQEKEMESLMERFKKMKERM